jgi:hypothetical protein
LFFFHDRISLTAAATVTVAISRSKKDTLLGEYYYMARRSIVYNNRQRKQWGFYVIFDRLRSRSSSRGPKINGRAQLFLCTVFTRKIRGFLVTRVGISWFFLFCFFLFFKRLGRIKIFATL